LTPCDENIHILGGTSDHLIVDITEAERRYAVGDTIIFYPSYTSLLAAATSEYVEKICFFEDW
jgi:predicted amino acid racemase